MRIWRLLLPLAACLLGSDALANHGRFSAPASLEPALSLVPANGSRYWGSCSQDQLRLPFEPLDTKHCLQANLVYVRVPKTGSSSFNGVVRRISARYGLSGVNQSFPGKLPEPVLCADHAQRQDLETHHIKGLTQPRIYVTMLRDPVERRLSYYYYQASYKPVPGGVLRWLKDLKPSYYYDYLKTDNSQSIGAVLDKYALVGVTERFEESVVLLVELLGLQPCDALFLNGKVGGESTFGAAGKTYLPHIPLKQQPQQVRDYAASKEFQDIVADDKKIYKWANERMDNEIKRIGEHKFADKLKEFQKWKAQAHAHCRDNFNIPGNDIKEWRKHNCYHLDLGCGYTCFDDFCKRQGL